MWFVCVCKEGWLVFGVRGCVGGELGLKLLVVWIVDELEFGLYLEDELFVEKIVCEGCWMWK